METLENGNIVIKSLVMNDEIKQISNYIKEKLTAIFDYLSLDTNKTCTVHIITSKPKLDVLYSELVFDDNDRKSGKEVPLSVVDFYYNDNYFILNYENYKDTFKHDKTTFEEYENIVLSGIIPLIQRWKFGKLSNSKVINEGFASYISGQDTNVKLLIDSYHDLIKSDNTKIYGDFFKYLDNTLSKEEIFKLLSGDVEDDKIIKLYTDYKRQFMSSRIK